jgi:hypothetical protein
MTPGTLAELAKQTVKAPSEKSPASVDANDGEGCVRSVLLEDLVGDTRERARQLVPRQDDGLGRRPRHRKTPPVRSYRTAASCNIILSGLAGLV